MRASCIFEGLHPANISSLIQYILGEIRRVRLLLLYSAYMYTYTSMWCTYGLIHLPTNKILLSSSLFPSLTMRSLDRKTSRACFQPDHYSIVIRRLFPLCSCFLLPLFVISCYIPNAQCNTPIADPYNIACIRGEIVTRCSEAQFFPSLCGRERVSVPDTSSTSDVIIWWKYLRCNTSHSPVLS